MRKLYPPLNQSAIANNGLTTSKRNHLKTLNQERREHGGMTMTISKLRACLFGTFALIALALAGTIGPVQRAISQGMVQITSLVGTEQISLNYPCTVSCFVTSAALANYTLTQPGSNMDNALIGGDSDTNLYQRGTTGASVTTTTTYGGPDRWAYWSGTNTAMTVSRTTTAGDLPATKTFASGFKMARTNGQTGVVDVCMIQAVESVNSYQFSGQTAELDFHATAGATFTGASSVMKAYFITGTGTDEGAAKAAFGLNAGGGGGAGWTGQANVAVSFTISTTNTRYTAVAPIPAGTTEIAVALCWTPVGTAGANDYIAFSGIQLTRNASLTTAAGTTGAALSNNDTRAKSFARRSQALETELQRRYYYQITEGAATTVRALCTVTTANTTVQCFVPFPVTMRTAPTMSYATGFALPTTTAATALNNNTGLATSATVSGNASNPLGVLVQASNASGTTAAVGLSLPLMDNGGSGIIRASAEL